MESDSFRPSLGMCKVLLVPSKTGVSVSPSPVEVVIKSCCLQSQIPWDFSVPLLNPQAGKPDVGFRTFTTVGELLWYYWSSVCGSPTQRVAQVTQLCLTLCHPMDCSPPGSSVHGILQARILEWVAILFSRGSSQPRDQTQVSHIAGGFFTIWAPGKPTWWVWDLILSWLCPSYHLAVDSPLSLDVGLLFLVGSSILLWWLFNG